MKAVPSWWDEKLPRLVRVPENLTTDERDLVEKLSKEFERGELSKGRLVSVLGKDFRRMLLETGICPSGFFAVDLTGSMEARIREARSQISRA